MIKCFVLAALMLAAYTPTLAQKNDDWWKMPGTKKVNPERGAKAGSLNPVKWTFPDPGKASVVIESETYHQLATEVFAKRTTIGPDKDVEAAAVLFTPKMVAILQLAQINDPDDIPDLDRFMIMAAVNLAVEDPDNKGFHRYIGRNVMFSKLFYFYELKSGQVVAANISANRHVVIILPGPASQR